jgi:hypothetical protein
MARVLRTLPLIGAAAIAATVAACGGDADGVDAQARARPNIDRVLRPAPRDCDAPPLARRHVSRAYAPLLGSAPIWFGPYLNVDQRRAIFRIPRDAPRTREGWRVKFLWIVRKRAPGPITVSGVDARGRPLLLAPEDENLGPTARFDPARADAVASGFVEFPSYVYFPGAGCFVLTARWNGGSWRLSFAAGR